MCLYLKNVTDQRTTRLLANVTVAAPSKCGLLDIRKGFAESWEPPTLVLNLELGDLDALGLGEVYPGRKTERRAYNRYDDPAFHAGLEEILEAARVTQMKEQINAEYRREEWRRKMAEEGKYINLFPKG